jgi:lipopolysaccharide biosynthesis protein
MGVKIVNSSSLRKTNEHLKHIKNTEISSQNSFDHRKIGIDNNRTEKVAVLVHCYFIDVLIEKIIPKLLPLSKYADFYFNFFSELKPEEQEIAVNLIKSNFDNYVINRTNRNVGRDINGQFNNLKSIYDENKSYDYYLFLHTKKSIHMDKKDSDSWIYELLYGTVYDYTYINEVLDNFGTNQKVGMIGSKIKMLPTLEVSFEANKEKYDEICRILKIDKNLKSFFVAGTMFWIRSEIIDHYFRRKNILKLMKSKLEENHLIDGDWHHTFERIFGTLCYSLGYNLNNCDI